MILDPRSAPPLDVYRFLISAVVPRPIAFVSSRGADGSVNLAPFSFFNAFSGTPPMIGIAILERGDDPKDTLRNIRETREFVVNIVNEPLLEAMVRTSGDWPRGTSEFDVAGLHQSPSKRVRPPGVAESPIQLECSLDREIPIGNSVLLVGEVLLASVRDDVLTDGRVDAAKLAPVARLGGEFYEPLREVLKVPRPRVSRATGQPLG